MMNDSVRPLTSQRLRTPRAAAVAGILFSLLLSTAYVLIRISIPTDPADGGAWLEERAGTVALALSMVFMFSLGTIWVRTRTMPRWLALLTFGLAIVLLVSIGLSLWVTLIFPAWVLTISVYILIWNLRLQGAGDGLSVMGGQRP